MSKKILDLWDKAAEKYALEQEASPFAELNKQIVENRFHDFTGKRVLDLGCGYGGYTEMFRKSGNRATGCDGSEKMIEIAKEKYPDCNFLIADIEKKLPFADKSFDLILCNQVLMDIKDFASTIAECSRLTVTGGILYIGIVHPAFYDSIWKKDASGFYSEKRMRKYLSNYTLVNTFWGNTTHYHRTISEYVNKMIENGFQLKHMKEPESYDGISKSKEFPLFLFLEFEKI